MTDKELIKIKTKDGASVALWKNHGKQSRSDKNIFLTHGNFSNRKVLLRVSSYLAEAGYTCWIMEWRNHGESSIAKDEFNYETISEYDTLAVFDYLFKDLEIKNVSCLSHSGGGFILTMFLIKNKEYISKVNSMVFFGSQVYGAGYNWKNYSILMTFKFVSKILGRIPARIAGAREHDESYYTMKQWIDWNLNKNFLGKDDFDYLKEIDLITMPILSISGEADFMIAPKIACEEFLTRFPNIHNKFINYSKENGNLENYNHSKVLNSKNAQIEIWPTALEWIEKNQFIGMD